MTEFITGGNEDALRLMEMDEHKLEEMGKREMNDVQRGMFTRENEAVTARKQSILSAYSKLSDQEREKFADMLEERKKTLQEIVSLEDIDEGDRAARRQSLKNIAYLESILMRRVSD